MYLHDSTVIFSFSCVSFQSFSFLNASIVLNSGFFIVYIIVFAAAATAVAAAAALAFILVAAWHSNLISMFYLLGPYTLAYHL